MKRFRIEMWKSIISVFLITLLIPPVTNAQSDLWVTAYYAGWSQGQYDNGALTSQEIDYSAVTHIIHFALVPQSDGSLNSTSNSLVPGNSLALITRAHTAGKKVLVTVGGWGTNLAFRSATNPGNLTTFVGNLVNFMVGRGYDGIDVDWEPLDSVDTPQYEIFIQALRTALDQITPRPLLMAAVGWRPDTFAHLSNLFDQINIMTYDLSGNWYGWVTWHNAPVLTNGLKFPTVDKLLPSAETMLDEFIAAGVPPNKLGIGIDFYGYVWSGGSGTPTGGATAPLQSWISPPQVQANVAYSTIMQNYFQPQFARWDTLAEAAYLSIDNTGSVLDKFISYDNEMSCRKKVDFARTRGIGGVFIWELGGGQLPSTFPERDRLLQATKNAVLGITLVPGIPSPSEPMENTTGITTVPLLSWTSSLNASSYRLQVSTDSTFSSVFFDRSSIFQTSFQIDTLLVNTTYYWRVCGINTAGAGNWSTPSRFTTIANQTLPTGWSYISYTGNSATITFPDTLIPLIGDSALTSGDAIGVFYLRGDTSVCAGYGVWNKGASFYFTIWGDNPSTAIKDGLFTSDTLLFKMWSVQNQKEYDGIAAFQSGNSRYEEGKTYVLRSLYDSTSHRSGGTNSIDKGRSPPAFALEQNYPNPFNPSTKIEYSLAFDSNVIIEIFNALGQKIATIVDDSQRPGSHQIQFNAHGLPSGVYFYRLTATPTSGNLTPSTSIRRMILLK